MYWLQSLVFLATSGLCPKKFSLTHALVPIYGRWRVRGYPIFFVATLTEVSIDQELGYKRLGSAALIDWVLQKFRCWKEVEIFNPSSGSNCDLLVVKMENWPNFRFLSIKRHKWCCFFWPDGSFRSLGSNIHSQKISKFPKQSLKRCEIFFHILSK